MIFGPLDVSGYKNQGLTKIACHKQMLVAKGFTQLESFDDSETFSPASCKESFKIVMTFGYTFQFRLSYNGCEDVFCMVISKKFI